MESYKNILNRYQFKILYEINKILKTLPSSVKSGCVESEDVVCKIIDLEGFLQDLFQRISDIIYLDFDNIISEKYKVVYDDIKNLYEMVEKLSLNFQLVYNHILVHIKEMYSILRSDIEKSIINDSVLYRKCITQYVSLNLNFHDTSYGNVCKIIMSTLALKKNIENYKKIISYHERRMEKTQEMWKSVELEFFGIAYSPEIVKKTVWNEQEFNEYKNMLIC